MSDVSQRKLKITHEATGNVTVIQDGSAADSDATVKYDDGFTTGIAFGNTGEFDKIKVVPGVLDNSLSGSRFTFRIEHGIWSNYLAIQPHDVVEFYTLVGDALSTVGGGTVPSWHHAEQSGQILIFYGRVTEVKPSRQGTQCMTEVSCADAREWSNNLTVVRDLGEGVEIPHLILNAENKDRDWIYAVKKKTDATFPSTPTFETGAPTNDDGRLTIYDALRYFQAEYSLALTALGVKDSGVDLFVNGDINDLTTELPRMDFVSMGFGESIGRLLQLAPDRDLWIDPKTKRWRLIRSRFFVVADTPGVTSGTPSDVDSDTVQYTVDDVSAYSTTSTANGYNVLLVDGDTPQWAIQSTVEAIDASALTINIADPGRDFVAGSLIVPLHPDASRLPQVAIDIGEATSVNLQTDLSETYSAVSIVGASNKTETSTQTLSPTDAALDTLTRAWNTDFETGWDWSHGDREADWGSDGTGIELYKHEVISEVSHVWFRATQSQYGEDHSTESGVGEWDGCAFQLIKNLDTNTSNDGVISNIASFLRVNDVDGAGNPGWKCILNDDLTTHSNGVEELSTEVAQASGVGIDRFVMSQNLTLYDMDGVPAVTHFNRRWEVFRSFTVTDTTVTINPLVDPAPCPPTVRAFQGPGHGIRPQPTLNPFSGAAPRTFQEILDFHGQPASGPNFWVRGFFLNAPQPTHEAAPCFVLGTDADTSNRIEVVHETITNEIRQVRTPANDFAGLAKLFYGYERELFITADRFDDDNKAPMYQAIVDSIWRLVSDPVYLGQLTLRGVQEWLTLSNLFFLVRLTTSNVAAGAINDLQKVLVPLSRVTFDFEARTTQIEFTNKDTMSSLNDGILERLFVEDAAKLKQVEDALSSLEHRAECVPPSAAPITTPRCTVINSEPGWVSSQPSHGPRPPINPKQEVLALTQGTADYTASSVSRVHGMTSRGIMEVDRLGQVFYSGPEGILPGTVSGSTFTAAPTSTNRLTAVPQVNQDGIEHFRDGFFGLDMNEPIGVLHAKIDASSTTTVVEVAYPGMTTNEYSSGTLYVLDGQARPAYSITSNTATAVTLTGAMSETAPVEGCLCIIIPAPKAPLDASDFPNGGTAIKDANDAWVVFEAGGTVYSAEVDSSGNIVKTAPQETRDINLGDSTILDVKPKGDWDFTGATVTNLPASESVATDAVDSDAILADAVITVKINDGAVTAAKQENISTATIIGRTTGGAGSREQLTATQARSVIAVTSTADLASTSNAKGASLIGIEDSARYTAAGTVEAALAELYLSLGDSIVLGLRRSGTWTAGQRIQGWTDSTDTLNRLRVPSGKTFEITMVGCHIQNGSASGTYAYRAGVTEYAVDGSTGSATARYAVDSGEWTDTTVSGHYHGFKKWDGVTALASVTGGAAISILPCLESESSSPGTTTSENCHVIVVGRFV